MRIALVGSLILAVFLVSVTVAAQRGPGGGTSVSGLTPAQQQAFDEGRRTFAKEYTVAEGLGPVFNDESCADCHRNGGGSNRTVTRFGRIVRDDFDPLAEFGGSLQQSRGIGSVTTVDGTHQYGGERIPAEATVRARRRSMTLQGLGFVDAVPDAAWFAIAEAERASDATTAGRVHLVRVFASVGDVAVGKFGWKAQVSSLVGFSGDALLNEMGITSPGFRDEICPQGDCLSLGFNPAPALNDDGRDVAAIADFMTMLAAPARGPLTDEVTAGEQVFQQIGCAACHRADIQTGPSPIRALDRTVFHPYSDFLLHDMGGLGDGIAQGQARGVDMRTAPLWGLRTTNRLLHDGSATTIEDAIRRHDGQARASRVRFEALEAERLSALLVSAIIVTMNHRTLLAAAILIPAVVAACAHAPLAPSTVVGETWQLVSLQATGGTAVAVDNPARYTVMLGNDGRLSVKSDCNSCRSSYSFSGSALTVQALACTRAYCGTTSLDTPFTSALAQAQTVALDGEEMTIQSEGATARFRR